MAGIYFHIPFCKQACHYCDFHFSTSTARLHDMVEAMLKELEDRRMELQGHVINSIYFGGGTPSVLDEAQVSRLIERSHQLFDVHAHAEITLEANPDDLVPAKILALQRAGVNRLSIGVQSFDDAQLKRMNRAHSAQQAEAAIKGAQDKGIENITADLIFALPGLTVEAYRADVMRLLNMGVQHLSAYGLTIEPRTVFHHMAGRGDFKEADAAMFEQHFRTTPHVCAEYGLEHYEVSNFGKPNFYSKHNSAYWKGDLYLGIGPSAHSYDGSHRRWNMANNPIYLKRVYAGEVYWEQETLTPTARCNEYLMTGLRTKWGIDTEVLTNHTEWGFGHQQFELLDMYIAKGLAKKVGTAIVLTIEGLLQVDTLTADLFVEQS